MSHIKDRLKQYKDEYSKYGEYDGLYVADVLEMLDQIKDNLEQDEKENGWIPVSADVMIWTVMNMRRNAKIM